MLARVLLYFRALANHLMYVNIKMTDSEQYFTVAKLVEIETSIESSSPNGSKREQARYVPNSALVSAHSKYEWLE